MAMPLVVATTEATATERVSNPISRTANASEVLVNEVPQADT
jgi:hypothetical protein